MTRNAIIGAGLIGHTWAVVVARARQRALVHDIDPEALAALGRRVAKALADLDDHGLLNEPPGVIAGRITSAATLEAALEGAEVVLECAPEQREVKQTVFERLDALAAPDALLASATSTIPASTFTQELPGRDRCIIIHPSTPPHILPLVEICPAPWTAPEAVERALAHVRALGQVPSLIRKEIDGFVLNRLQAAMVCEAYRLWEDGIASAADIEATVRETLATRWSLTGPFESVALNAPNGLVDYLEKFGGLFHAINATQQARPFDMEAVRRLDAERIAAGLSPDVEARRSQRDRRLLALAAHRKRSG